MDEDIEDIAAVIDGLTDALYNMKFLTKAEEWYIYRAFSNANNPDYVSSLEEIREEFKNWDEDGDEDY